MCRLRQAFASVDDFLRREVLLARDHEVVASPALESATSARVSPCRGSTGVTPRAENAAVT